MLLLALMYYLWYEAPKYEQNFGMVMELLRAGDIPDEENANAMPSTLDELFAELESRTLPHRCEVLQGVPIRLCQNAEIGTDHAGGETGEIQPRQPCRHDGV